MHIHTVVQKLQQELEEWARANGRLSDTQHIYLCAMILNYPPAAAAEVKEIEATRDTSRLIILEMKAIDFFTEERFRAAGVNMHALTRIKSFLEDNQEKIVTIGDLARMTRSQILLLRSKNMGGKTIAIMQYMLGRCGVKVDWEYRRH